MQSELKPCPFCGCEKVIDGYIRDGRRIFCGECHATVAAFHPDASKRAAERWNQRAEATLSAAEPSVAEQIADSVLSWMVKHHLLDADNEYRATDVLEVLNYLAPEIHTAPSFAVKELQWDEDGDNLKARMGDREWMLNITSDGKTWAGSTRPFVFGRNLTWSSVPNCSMVSLEEAKAACQADCQSRYAALSAQAQDVAGWQLVPKEPTQEMLERGADSSCSLTIHGANGVYSSMLAAAPEKQEGGE